MNDHVLRTWFKLAYILHLSASVACLDVLYPKIGTIYPVTGPDDVQWETNDITDPSELAIYLVTYKGQNITNQRPCINSSTSDGSTAISLSHPAPHGDSWTWMFYDNDVVIAPGYNYIAESVHFQVQGATPTPSATANNGIGSLSPAVAAAVGVGGTIVLVLIGVFMAYCCFYRRRRRKRKGKPLISAPLTPSGPHSKHELDSKPGTCDHSSSPSELRYQKSFSRPFAPPSHHEMEVFPGSGKAVSPSCPSVTSPASELSTLGYHSQLPSTYPAATAAPWRDLAVSPVRHEMHHDSRRVFPQELPGDFDFGTGTGNGVGKEFI